MAISTVESDTKAISSVSVTFDYTLVSGAQYILRASCDLWYRISSGATAAVAGADENHFLAKGQTAPIAAKGTANRLTAIRDSVDGNASLSLVQGAV